MNIVLSAFVCITWVTVMVTTQEYPQIESPASCEHTYNFRGPSKGIFQSPEFPNNYPERTRCKYFFQARETGRIRINFDFFDLETSDDEYDCKYDYLEFFNINEKGVKEKPTSRYCGKSKPPEYISARSRMEIIFFSDVTTNARGFFGHYEFLETKPIKMHYEFGVKEKPTSRYCGKSKPAEYISARSRMKIIFFSDVTTNARGFVGHDEFFETNWHPFPLSTIGCGAGYLTGPGGVIQSPNHPGEYPAEAGCTWIVNVKPTEQILLHFVELDITSTMTCQEANSLMVFEGFVIPDTMPISYCVTCQEANSLMVFEGFVTPDTMPISYCGQLSHERQDKREYLSRKNRLVLRFQSGISNTGNHVGFKAIWTAVTLARKGQCGGEKFECQSEVPGACMPEQQMCHENHYCVHESLTCNDVPNCGANDHSDENKCLYYILKYVGYIGGSVVAFILLLITAVCCYRRHCRRGVRYSVPKEQQSLSQSATQSMMSTHSSNLHVRSLDHSPRSSCVMYTTAFTGSDTGSPMDHSNRHDHSSPLAHANRMDHPSPLAHSNCKLAEKPPLDRGEHAGNSNSLPSYPNNTSSFVPDPLEEESAKNYRGHQKRPSYHMMKEIYYDDGKIVTANI